MGKRSLTVKEIDSLKKFLNSLEIDENVVSIDVKSMTVETESKSGNYSSEEIADAMNFMFKHHGDTFKSLVDK